MTLAIFHRLEAHYGKGAVFIDIDRIPFGTDFRKHICNELRDCDILIAIVGRKWLGPIKRGPPRIKDEGDWVRLEIETALDRDIQVVPVLVDGATMPKKDQVPETIDLFRYRQAARIDHGAHFFAQMDRLVYVMDRTLKGEADESWSRTTVNSLDLQKLIDERPNANVSETNRAKQVPVR